MDQLTYNFQLYLNDYQNMIGKNLYKIVNDKRALETIFFGFTVSDYIDIAGYVRNQIEAQRTLCLKKSA